MKNIAIIYDLDETLFKTSSMPTEVLDPFFQAITDANIGTVNEQALHDAFKALWRKPLDQVAEEYGFSSEMVHAGKKALEETDYKLDIAPYADFSVIKELPGLRFLVTTGTTKLQQAKIDALFTTEDFTETIIDDPYATQRLGKKQLFAQIAKKYGLTPSQVWVVGDNPDAEIRAGKELQMKTVQITRPGIKEKPSNADYQITSLQELKEIINNTIHINIL